MSVARAFRHVLIVHPLLLLGLNAYATAPTIAGFTGVSAQTLTAPVTAYGGIAGTCDTQDGVNACNSCTAAGVATCTTAPLCKCNQANIYDNLAVRVVLTNPATTTTGTACAAAADANQAGTKVVLPKVSLTNDYTFVDFTWQNICNKIQGAANCAGVGTTTTTGAAASINVDIWVSAAGHICGAAPATGDSEITTVVFKVVNPGSNTFDVYGTPAEGIYSFLPYPGDGKVYLEQVQSTTGFPVLSYQVSAANVVVFISPTSMDDANYQNPPLAPALLPIVDNGNSLQKNIVDGLQNDQRYFFRLALQDAAGNIVQYFPGVDGGGAGCLKGGDPTQCAYSATPSQVLGLLSKDLNCFVATAAYGSPLEPKIQTFRDFRHRFLLTNEYGLAFVHSYYHYGPLAARYIADKPVIRALVRGFLWPMWGFSYLALRIGFSYAFALSLLMIAFGLSLPWAARRRWQSRV